MKHTEAECNDPMDDNFNECPECESHLLEEDEDGIVCYVCGWRYNFDDNDFQEDEFDE